jgi:YD repeat-containing protein
VVTCYSSESVATMDEAGVVRIAFRDGLGRTYRVTESGTSADTYYTYDSLDNLTGVTPAIGSGRSFVYDSLGRLTHACNPEAGTSGTVCPASAWPVGACQAL